MRNDIFRSMSSQLRPGPGLEDKVLRAIDEPAPEAKQASPVIPDGDTGRTAKVRRSLLPAAAVAAVIVSVGAILVYMNSQGGTKPEPKAPAAEAPTEEELTEDEEKELDASAVTEEETEPEDVEVFPGIDEDPVQTAAEVEEVPEEGEAQPEESVDIPVIDTGDYSCGLMMTARVVMENNAATGAVLRFEQTSDLENVSLSTGMDYVLYRYNENKELEEVPTVTGEPLTWNALALILPTGKGQWVDETLNWEMAYGPLGPGRYVIEKHIYASIDDGEELKENILTAEFAVEYPATQWGLSLEAENVTPTGLTAVFRQSLDMGDMELYTGSEFRLYRKTSTGRETIPYKNGHDDNDIAWTMEAYSVPVRQGEEARMEIDWSELYGELEPGQYIIEKNVTCGDELMSFTAVFEIK